MAGVLMMKRNNFKHISFGSVGPILFLSYLILESKAPSDGYERIEKHPIVQPAGRTSVCERSVETADHLGGRNNGASPERRDPQFLAYYRRNPQGDFPEVNVQEETRRCSLRYGKIQARSGVSRCRPRQTVDEASDNAVVFRQRWSRRLLSGDPREGRINLFYRLPRRPVTALRKEEYGAILGPPQCPYRTWRRNVRLPLIGDIDLLLFCVPP